jgi:hypothetical protein
LSTVTTAPVPNKKSKMFVDFEAKSIKKREKFVVDPGLHTQNCRNARKYTANKRKST